MILHDILELLAKPPRPERQCSFGREQVAAAALLVECAQADTDFAPQEHQVVWAAVRRHFGLDDQTCEELLAVGMPRTGEVWHDWIFVEAIRRGFTQQEQREILERLWEAADADGHVHPFEVHLLSRAARELGISHEFLEEARFKTRKRLAGGPQAPQHRAEAGRDQATSASRAGGGGGPFVAAP